MPSRRNLAFVLLLAVGAAAPSSAGAEEGPLRATAMAQAAADFLAQLAPAQRQRATQPFGHRARTRWQATPGRRLGLAWRDMNDTQRAAAEALLRTGLSAEGLRRFQGVVQLEGILHERETAHRPHSDFRDPGLYWLAIFGTPSAGGVWSWRVEGHHYSRHFTCAGGEVSVTPAFHGANPAHVRRGAQAGLRVLDAEEREARALLLALDAGQRAKAVLASAPRDFLPSAPRNVARMARQGLKAVDMTDAQRAQLWRLLGVWVGALHPDLAADVLRKVRALDPGSIHFGWLGSAEEGRSHGYRLHGPAFLLEYWHAGNHIHSVWRGMANEYGVASIARAARSRPGR